MIKILAPTFDEKVLDSRVFQKLRDLFNNTFRNITDYLIIQASQSQLNSKKILLSLIERIQSLQTETKCLYCLLLHFQDHH